MARATARTGQERAPSSSPAPARPSSRRSPSSLKLDTIALGNAAVRGPARAARAAAHARSTRSCWGGVILPSAAPNVGREIALDLGLPPTVEAMTFTRACAAGLQAITLAVAAIERGEGDVVIAGGSDSTSNAEIELPQKVVRSLGPLRCRQGARPPTCSGVLAQLMPLSEMLPRMPQDRRAHHRRADGRERREDGAPQRDLAAAQDEFAARSHHRAAAAIASGRFGDEVAPVETRRGWVHTDSSSAATPASRSSPSCARCSPRTARLTAGNSSPLTDGAAAVLLMSEDKAKALGYTPLARFARGPTSASIRPISCSWARPWPCRRRSSAPGTTSPTWTSSTCTRRSRPRC